MDARFYTSVFQSVSRPLFSNSHFQDVQGFRAIKHAACMLGEVSCKHSLRGRDL